MKKILNFLKNLLKANPYIKVPFLLLLIIVAVLFKSNYKIFKVEGESMSQTFDDGDVVMVGKHFYNYALPERGDVVVCWEKGEVLIKRIIGVPGDTVEIIEGFIILNDNLYEDEFEDYKIAVRLVDVDGEFLKDWVSGEPVYEYINEHPVYLQSTEYWVIGDNRAISWYGVIDEVDIIGKVYE